MYTLYKFNFLNRISEINQLFDDILIIWPAPVLVVAKYPYLYCEIIWQPTSEDIFVVLTSWKGL